MSDPVAAALPQQLKEAFKMWHQSGELGRSSLASWRIVSDECRKQGLRADANGRSTALRTLLRRAIDALAPPEESPPTTWKIPLGSTGAGGIGPSSPCASCAAKLA